MTAILNTPLKRFQYETDLVFTWDGHRWINGMHYVTAYQMKVLVREGMAKIEER